MMRYKNEKLHHPSHTEVSIARGAVCRHVGRHRIPGHGPVELADASLFGLKLITYWQAVGLLILSKILFGGFRGSAGRGGHRLHSMRGRWRQRTPEEREQFRQNLRACWSRMASPDAKPTT